MTDDGRIGQATGRPSFYWNARKQLEVGINVLRVLGGPELPACRDLATGSTMGFMSAVVAAATDAFDELARAAQSIEPPL